MPSVCALTSHTAMSIPAMASITTPRRRLSSAWVMPRSSTARAVIHLFVDPLREHRILTDAFRGELMLDDGSNDRRRAESRADASQSIVCLDADERCITLD